MCSAQRGGVGACREVRGGGLGWVGYYNHEVLWCTSPVLTGTLTQSKASQLSQGHEGFESIGGKRLKLNKRNTPPQQH